jgi:crossover junction endodeoxyribonuclease RuvC
MPTVTVRGKARVDAAQVAHIVRAINPDRACIELVGAMPGQGVSSMFAFGRASGLVEGVIAALGVPLDAVPPATWKASLRVPREKNAARARASQLLPNAAHWWPLAKHDGRAEAALLALYGSRMGSGTSAIEW